MIGHWVSQNITKYIKRSLKRMHINHLSFLKNEKSIPKFMKTKQKNFYDLKLKIEKTKDKVVFGPFYSEVGYELIYWFPLISWLTENINRNKISFVSRGGLAKFFFEESADYCLIEKYGNEKVEQLIRDNSKNHTSSMKQKSLNNDDHSIVKEVINDDNFLLVPPSKMFQLYKPFYSGYLGERFLLNIENYNFMKKSKFINDKNKKYDLCIKIYDCHQFKIKKFDMQKINDFVRNKNFKKIILLISKKYDDHEQFDGSLLDFDYKKINLEGPNNLLEQATIISQSRLFLTSYGGISYLGPMVGTNTLSLIDDDRYNYFLSNYHFTKFMKILYHTKNEKIFTLFNSKNIIL